MVTLPIVSLFANPIDVNAVDPGPFVKVVPYVLTTLAVILKGIVPTVSDPFMYVML